MKNQLRQLNKYESDLLSKNITELEAKAYVKLNWRLILTLLFLTALFVAHSYYSASNLTIISKFLVCFCPVLIWVIVKGYHDVRSKNLKILQDLKTIQQRNEIEVLVIQAKRIMLFEEEEDEGILYLIEELEGNKFYLDDEQYMISPDSSFPCENFEIYANPSFKYAIERKVCCKGGEVDLIVVSAKEKNKYFRDKPFSSDLAVENSSFEEILNSISKSD